MNRLHTREEYMTLIDKIRTIIPDGSISQDMITGFPTETEEDHQDTLSLMEYVKYNFGYMYSYSERPGTLAGRKMEDDVSEEIKARRLQVIYCNKNTPGCARTIYWANRRGFSRKISKNLLKNFLRNSQSITVVFPKKIIKLVTL
jgi:tRNA-2-methylthio-N6-dimethylallyladenosine synthase